MTYNYALKRYSYDYGASESPDDVTKPMMFAAVHHLIQDDSSELFQGKHGTAYMYRWGRCWCWQCRAKKSGLLDASEQG